MTVDFTLLILLIIIIILLYNFIIYTVDWWYLNLDYTSTQR